MLKGQFVQKLHVESFYDLLIDWRMEWKDLIMMF